MTRYRQFCPIAKGAEIFAERWTPLILREMLCGSHRFAEIQRGIPRISQSLLATRLRSLEREGIIERRPARDGHGFEYHLTPAGRELGTVVELLGGWGYRWVLGRLRAEDLDPPSVLWFLHRYIRVERLPAETVVVRVDLRDDPLHAWWLILRRTGVELCFRDEGFSVDLWVTADAPTLAAIILGELEPRAAMRSGRLQVDGPRPLVRQFPDWLGVTQFTRYGRPGEIDHLLDPGIAWAALASPDAGPAVPEQP